MRKKGKRKTAWLLSAAMFLSVLFSGNVYAEDDINADLSQNNVKVEAGQNDEAGAVTEGSDDTGIQENFDNSAQSGRVEEEADEAQNTQESSAPNQTENVEDSVPAEQGLINYVGVDYPYMATPADQNIVISYGDGSENVSDARIVIRKDDGGTLEMELSKKEGELFLFTYSFDETASGIYELVDFIYTQDGVEQTIHLSDIGIESVFGVNEEYPGYGATSEENSEQVTAQELEMSVVDVETGEVEAATADVEEAIEAAEEQVETVQESRTSRAAAASSRSDDLVVVLDPGHGGRDGGASANGLVEKELNLKIAQYCKAELEQYNGVTVYMTRTDDTYLDIDERVYKARDMGADVLVSIHINSAGAAASGAEVYYPNDHYNPSVHEPGKNLAQQIQNQLVSLGLADRGIKVRNTVNDIYPDGSKQDYYGIIRYSKLCGFPGIIVEHAFISNPSDAAKLAQESFLQQLGIADATGIANAYGLSKINIEGSAEIALSQDENKGTVRSIVTKGAEYVTKLSVAVWGDESGQNDLKWYDMQQGSDDAWTTDIEINNHKESGNYHADVYAVCSNGEKRYIDGVQFAISNPTAEVEISPYDDESGTFEITAKNVYSPSGVEEIRFPVWYGGNQAGTIHWYTAERQADGSYKSIVNVKNHNYAVGTYLAHIYITAGNGVVPSSMAGSCDVTAAEVTVNVNNPSGDERNYQVTAQNISMFGGIGMRVAVWGDPNGQNDLKWYEGRSDERGTWKADIDIRNHRESGMYYADTYIRMFNGAEICVSSARFQVSNPTAEVEVGPYDKESGTFEITAKNVYSPSGVEEIRFPVWYGGNQAGTIHWYTAERQADGSYKSIVNVKNHNYAVGTYLAHIYITADNGVMSSSMAGSCDVTAAEVTVNVNNPSGDERNYQVTAQNIGMFGGIGMRVAVWGDPNGQNDLKWYEGRSDERGTWKADIDIRNHRESGMYYADTYIRMFNGAEICVSSARFQVSNPTAEVEVGPYDKESGTFEITAKNVYSPSGVEEIRFPVWYGGNQAGTIHWYTAERQADGSYKSIVNVKNHNYAVGTYLAHIYITAGNGVVPSSMAGSCDVTAAEVTVNVNNPSGDERNYQVTAQNIGMFGGIGMRVAVWGGPNGQNDLKWYAGRSDERGTWKADIDIRNHRESGTYYADTYIRMFNGAEICVSSARFQVSNPTAEVEVGPYDKESGTFEITAKNVYSPSGVEEIRFPVWYGGNQAGTIHWYTAERQADGSYKSIVNVKNHNYAVGTYLAHIYITAGNGTMVSYAASSIDIGEVVIKDLYTIMGESSVSEEQMISFFQKSNQKYPCEELGRGGAETINSFCQMICEEAQIEGVKSEVVFAQIMLETGYLQFGGDVKIEQFNFGGLGATGNGAQGASFPNVRTGIRANVQHLKCYGSTSSLRNPLVDPRWGEWLRNKAPYVQWLSIPQNPYGTGWASDPMYGDKILNIISALKTM